METGGAALPGSLVRVREGVVAHILASGEAWTEAAVDVGGGRLERSLSYHALTGPLRPGDRVSLNTTAAAIGLGTGGLHFVTAVHGRELDAVEPGHIMKVRYTPAQVKVLAVEEPASPHHEALKEIPDLGGMPVLVGTLHSQVGVAAAAVKARAPRARVVYLMTDGGALPAGFSRLTPRLKEAGLLDAVITAGHAFGGDYEAVTPASGLAAARVAAGADVVIAAMGPGVVGTGTPLGTTALEQGPLLDTAGALGGLPVALVRASQADGRERHRGISHHTVTVLTRFTHRPACVPLSPCADPALMEQLSAQAEKLERSGHNVVWEEGARAWEAARSLLRDAGVEVTTMGRTDRDDPLFFWTAAAAGAWAAGALLRGSARP